MTRRPARFRSEASDDETARRAAGLVHEGRAPDLGSALRELGGSTRLRGRARRHLEAMVERDAVVAGDPVPVVAVLDAAIAIMEAIDDLESRTADRGTPYRGVRLAGHAATGQVSPGEVLSIRHHGDRSLDDLEMELEDLGVVEFRRSALRSRWGTLSALEGELDGVPFRVRRCPVGQVPLDAGNLRTGRPVPLADLAAIRRVRDGVGT